MGPEGADPVRGIEDILSSLRSAEDEAAKTAPPRGKGPAAPSRAGGGVECRDAGAPADELKEFLMRRIEALEKGLAEERERASAAESRAAQQEANRGEVEEHLRAMSDLLKRDRDESHSRGRIEALETRLDKMHEFWATTLERLASRPEPEAAGKELAGVRERLDKLSAGLDDLMKRSATQSAGAAGVVAGRLDAVDKRLAELSASLAAAAAELAHVREWVQKLAGIFTESMDGMGNEVERTRAELAVIVKRLFDAGLVVEAAERRLAELIRRDR